MSRVSPYEMPKLLSPEQAVGAYDLSVLSPEIENMNDIAVSLATRGIAAMQTSLIPSDFQEVTTAFDIVIDSCPKKLPCESEPIHGVQDNTTGYVRKDWQSTSTGKQWEDPKSYIHFTEKSEEIWRAQGFDLRNAPREVREFLALGFALQVELLDITAELLRSLESTHPNITRLYNHQGPLSFLRLVAYDPTTPDDEHPFVAKPHKDRSGYTLQVYADGPGFEYMPNDRVMETDAEPDAWLPSDFEPAPSMPGEVQIFMGATHAKIYGKTATRSPIEPLLHAVKRQPGGTQARRHAIIQFGNPPMVDPSLVMADTLPQLAGHARS